MRVCPNCHFENAPTAAFCVNCGRALGRARLSPPPTPEAERRFATLLFADISGFTEMSEHLDPEAVREIINSCFDRLVPVVEKHQGVIDQFIGDELLALFGAPVAHENDPAQACQAALDMLDVMTAFNAERGLDLGLHVGINSGVVLAGGIGSRGRQQYTVMGDAVNLASRMEDAAERGEIFVGQETYRLTRDQFEFQARGAMPFKGKAEPQPVWQLVRVKQAAPVHRRIQTATPMLGRARELALLRRVTREELEEQASLRIVSILGEAGLGKSRLVQEWRDAASSPAAPLNLRFVVAACAPDGAARAYSMLAEIARALDGETVPPAEGPLQALLRGALTPDSAPADTATLQARYARLLRQALERRSEDAALVLVCEDVHWADASSVEALTRALTEWTRPAAPEVAPSAPNNRRILVCFTARPDRETPGWQLIETAQDLPGVGAVRIHLTPLRAQDAEALLANLLAGALPTDVERLVLEQAEGNPLFVEELVRMLLDRGDLQRTADGWMLTRPLLALDVPNTLQGVLMARVDELPPSARRLLQLASVLGREFPLVILEQLAAAPEAWTL